MDSSRGLRSAIGVHHTGVSHDSWDGPGNEARLHNDGDVAYYRQAYAWQDPDGTPDTKAAYKFIHHEVSSDGRVGAGNIRACSTGIGILNGGRGGTTIPDSDREGVWRHLAAHMRDGDNEPPPLRAQPFIYERRAFPFSPDGIELREAEESDRPMTIAWYPALFDSVSEDLGGFREKIGRRAFTASLQRDDVRALVNHDPNLILGRTSKGTLGLKVDLKGLRAEIVLPETSYVADLVTNVRNGNIGGGSFAFAVPEGRDTWSLQSDDERGEYLLRIIQEARLFDVSLVAFPAYTQTEGLMALRSLAEEWQRRLKTPASKVPLQINRYHRRLELLLRR